MAPANSDKKALLVFYSYSHKDDKFRKQLSDSLSALRREGAIIEWHDREITAGDQWADEIDEHMETADLILLLISRDFIASEYSYGKEMTHAVKRHNAGKARVIPVIVRPWDFSGTPFAKLQALPKDGKAVTMWANRDLAWLSVSQGISKAVKEIAVGVGSKQTAGASSIIASADAAPSTVAKSKKVRKKKQRGGRSLRSSSKQNATLLTTSKKIGERLAKRPGGMPRRTIYDARNSETLPGRIARREGKPPNGDRAVDEAYEWLGITYHFFWDVFQRDSVDGKGMPLEATVHFGKDFNNAFWNGKHMIIGDGDGKLFNRFTIAIDVVAKEFTNGVVQADTKLTYWEQSGALFNSIACVFAVLTKQYALKQTADRSDWLHGAGLLGPKVKGVAVSSFAAPGTAYHDKLLGKDPQPANMSKYVRTADDNGGIHSNTGIPNHAFYQVAKTLGGYAWERAGRIWYDAMRDKQLKPQARFTDFARITIENASRLYGLRSEEARAVRYGWAKVGVKPARS